MPEHPTFGDWNSDIAIAVLTEQVKGLRQDVADHTQIDQRTFDRIELNLGALRTFIEERYVTKEEIVLLKAIAYGIVTVFMLAILGTIAGIVTGGKGHSVP